MRTPDPYRYPAMPLARRHGPRGYAKYGGYREWLRDEFDFRCIYCLQRERWGQMFGLFDSDHFECQALRPDLALSYDNLVDACRTCNLAKGAGAAPDPHHIAYGACLRVEDNGEITALNDNGTRLIDEMELDAPYRNEWRRTVIETVAMVAKSGDGALLKLWMALPSELPDLSRSRPPGGNTRPEGIAASWHAKRAAGMEPEVFE